MDNEMFNAFLVSAYLILGMAIIVFLGYWALKKFGPPK
jgi:hypothetical protein